MGFDRAAVIGGAIGFVAAAFIAVIVFTIGYGLYVAGYEDAKRCQQYNVDCRGGDYRAEAK